MFQKFLSDLQQALKRLPLEDREKISAYYTELYFDKKDIGQSEEDIIVSFGNVGLIAERILKENPNRTDNSFTENKSPLTFGVQNSNNSSQQKNIPFDTKKIEEYSENQGYNCEIVNNQLISNFDSNSYYNHSLANNTKVVVNNSKDPIKYTFKLCAINLLSYALFFTAIIIIYAFFYRYTTSCIESIQEILLYVGLFLITIGGALILFGFFILCRKFKKKIKANYTNS